MSLQPLHVLLGEWIVESKAYPEGRGHMTVTLVDGGKFLRLETEQESELFPRSTLLVGADESNGHCTVLYYDARDVRRVYLTSVAGGEWRIWRDAPGFNQRFIGKIGAGGTNIAGNWEMSEDGSNWKVDFDLAYTKVG